ncbi:MAG: putative toxin-antitoxin system toxin component, PIN family [Deltaproteobacteria bacterium]|nr:putative toxin-antitoxin system toxin component, PIN family [Deltaproteobacteria bacterium]
MLKAVVDTNVLVSGVILSRGNPYEILEAWRRNELILLTTPEILEEVEAVLRRPKIFRKYRLTEAVVARLLDALNLEASLVGPVSIDPYPQVEPADLKFLACAEAGAADYLVTGDQALLNLTSYKATRIVSPSTFVHILSQG